MFAVSILIVIVLYQLLSSWPKYQKNITFPIAKFTFKGKQEHEKNSNWNGSPYLTFFDKQKYSHVNYTDNPSEPCVVTRLWVYSRLCKLDTAILVMHC